MVTSPQSIKTFVNILVLVKAGGRLYSPTGR